MYKCTKKKKINEYPPPLDLHSISYFQLSHQFWSFAREEKKKKKKSHHLKYSFSDRLI